MPGDQVILLGGACAAVATPVLWVVAFLLQKRRIDGELKREVFGSL